MCSIVSHAQASSLAVKSMHKIIRLFHSMLLDLGQWQYKLAIIQDLATSSYSSTNGVIAYTW